MKSGLEKTVFWILYLLYPLFWVITFLIGPIFYHWPVEDLFIGLIYAIVSSIVWYFALKAIFWVIRRIPKILKILWKFTLDRVREFGKALRDE